VPDAAPDAPPARVAVVGAGWSGCAAAVTLAGAGVPVTLFEQAKTLGGRARRVVHGRIAVDNGQHVLLGAYRQTLELLRLVHGAERLATLIRRLPLTLRPYGAARSAGVEMSAWRVPAPLHIAGAVLSARGLSWAERWAVIADYRRVARAGFQRPDCESVAQCFAGTPPRAFAAIWQPLCLAALNTAPEGASARMFAGVLRAAFTGSARHSDFLIPAVDLSACFPEAAQRHIEKRHGIVRLGEAVRAIARSGRGVELGVGGETEHYGAAIVAVGPHQLAAAIGRANTDDAWRPALARVGGFRYESITTIYVGFAGPVALAAPMVRLDDAPGQWMFDRTAALGHRAAGDARSLVAVVISAGGPHDAMDHPTLAARVAAQLLRLQPALPPIAWSRVIAEQRATYSCTPALPRPSAGRIAPGVYLAGDYTDAEFPATLEAACRSGVAAAHALLADRGATPV
jgi:squalene-associated FAD-dependent desaturase